MSYAFRLLSPAEEPAGVMGLAIVHDPRWKQVEQIVDAGQFGIYCAQIRGALLQRFGPPSEEDDPFDYTYVIEARAGDQRWVLVATARSIPDVAIDLRDLGDQAAYHAADALLALLDVTTPADYAIVTYDPEYDSTIHVGCRDGICSWEETRGDVT